MTSDGMSPNGSEEQNNQPAPPPPPPPPRHTPVTLPEATAAQKAGDDTQALVPVRRKPDWPVLLVSYGIPALLAIGGALAIFFWLRGDYGLQELQPRTFATDTLTDPYDVDADADPWADETDMPEEPADGEDPNALPNGDDFFPGDEADPAVSPNGFTQAAAPSRQASARTSPPSIPGSWPRFRGPDMTNVSPETGLARSWGAGGPRRLWSVKLGAGYAGAAVHNGRVYVLDYDERGQRDVLRCFSFADGSQLWETGYPAVVRRNHGMSRTMPTVSGRYVVTIGPLLTVMCTDAETGRMLWKHDLVEKYGATVPPWYAGQCPLVEGNLAIIAVGNGSLVVAFDLASGREVWATPAVNEGGRPWKMTHSSLMPMTFAGQKMYVYPASEGVAGISAQNGRLLWTTTEWKVNTANIPMPVPVGDGRIFLSGGYNAGAMMLQLHNRSGSIVPEVAFRLRPSVFGTDQHTPILYQGHIYGVAPNGRMVCLDLSGKQLWHSGTDRFGIGPYKIADSKIYAVNDRTGLMTVMEATPSAYNKLSQVKILNGPDVFAPLTIAGKRLIARDLTEMVCLDISR